ncbi:hypothetical protein ACWGB8_28855 [Kitasatospora sp. NPDC054939]
MLASLGLHRYAGGAPVGPDATAGAAALLGGLAYAAAGRQRRTGSLLLGCFTAQYGLHHWFSAAARPGPGHGGHQAPPHRVHHGPEEPAEQAVSHLAAAVEPEMLLVHALMALVCAWWLAQGEAALAGLLLGAAVAVGHWLRRLVRTAVPPAGPARRPVRAAAWDGPAPSLLSLLSTAVSRRGPPGCLPT